MIDHPLRIETKDIWNLSISHLQELPVNCSIEWWFSVPEECLILADSTDPGEMPPYAAFYQGLHCLLKYLFTGIQNEKSKGLHYFFFKINSNENLLLVCFLPK